MLPVLLVSPVLPVPPVPPAPVHHVHIKQAQPEGVIVVCCQR